MYHKANVSGGVQFDCTCQKGKRHKKAQAKALQPQLAANSDVKAEIEFIDIDTFYNFEARIGTEVIAHLFHDAFAENKGCWVVAVAGVELYRSHLWTDSRDWVKLQYEQGTLPQQAAAAQTVLLSKTAEVPEQQSSTEELLDKPFDELTADEWQQLRAVEPVPVIEQKPLSLSANLMPSVICHKCNGNGCGYCGYCGLTTEKSPDVYEMDGVQPAKYRFALTEYSLTSTTLATLVYQCFDQERKLGMVFRTRNPKCMWSNTPDTFYWTCGDGKQYSSALDVAESLTPQLVEI